MSGLFETSGIFRPPAYILTALLSLCGLCLAAEPKLQYDVPAGPLAEMLNAVGRQARLNILYFDSSMMKGMKAPALHGNFTADQAIARLLEGKPLHPVRSDQHTVMIEQNATAATRTVPAPPAKGNRLPEAAPVPASVAEVVINAPKAGYLTDLSSLVPIITVTRQQLEDRGYVQLSEFFRQLPQNFPGISPGSNPIVGNARGAGNNQTFAETIDLLGLGPGTTLVLLNNRRLPNSVIGQSVDISAIPVCAIDHIDIVKVGASATYGSDAIGGVVNIVTVSSYSGVETTARYGGTSEDKLAGSGGCVLAGNSWSGGNGVMTFDYERDDSLYASDRAYTSGAPGPTSLFPAMETYSGVASVRQELCERCVIRFDVFASRRTFDAEDALNDPMTKLDGRVDQWDAVMQLDYPIARSWNFNLAVQMATERDRVLTTDLPSGPNHDYYVNQAPSVESLINGALGPDSDPQVRIALGAAFRQEQFSWKSSYAPEVSNRRNITSVFGEVWLPLLDKGGWLPFTQELSADVSGRYDGYDSSGSSWDPRVALLWKTSDSMAWHTSFSRSFKSPSLFQLDSTGFAEVVQATNPASPGTPLNTLLIDGGNRRLTAERSRSTELGFTYQPQTFPDLKIDISGNDLTYTHRIDELSQDGFAAAAVIADAPVLGQLVNLNPTRSQVQEVLNTPSLVKLPPIDVDSIAAIENLGFSNVGSIHVRTIDATVHYSQDIAGDAVTAELVGSYYAKYVVRITPQSAQASFVGTAYRPSRDRAKLDLTWPHGNWSANLRWNFTGGYHSGIDSACPSAPGCPVSAWSTLDGTLTYSSPADRSSLLHGTRVDLSISNAFNHGPPYLYAGGLNYDPANASPAGRRIAITLKKQWGGK
jgi:outer membrane receptor protein involved in Fe transport